MNGIDMHTADLNNLHMQDFDPFSFDRDSISESSSEDFDESGFFHRSNQPQYYEDFDEYEEDDDDDDTDHQDYPNEDSEESDSEEEAAEEVQVVRAKRNTKSVSDVCVICTDNFDRNSPNAAYFECNHWFHYNCITQWIQRKNKCPHCMTRVTVLSVNNG
jgi:hypothetical protein